MDANAASNGRRYTAPSSTSTATTPQCWSRPPCSPCYLRYLSLPHLNCGKSKPDTSVSYALPSADPEARDVPVHRLGDEGAEQPDQLRAGRGASRRT